MRKTDGGLTTVLDLLLRTRLQECTLWSLSAVFLMDVGALMALLL